MPPGRLHRVMLNAARKRRPTAKPTKKRIGPIEPAPFDVALDASAQAFLDNDQRLSALSEAIENDPERFVATAADVVSKATQEQHHRALAFAYALWLRASQNPAYDRFVDRLRQRRERDNKLTTDLHLLVEAVVTYGGAKPKDRRDKRGLYQRDVSALRYLHHQRVGPNDLENLASRAGQGLDTWARRWPKVRQKIAPETNAAVTPAPGIEVEVRKTALDGTVMTERYPVADDAETHRLLELLRGQCSGAVKVTSRRANALRPTAKANNQASR